jgi:hypothetical protein
MIFISLQALVALAISCVMAEEVVRDKKDVVVGSYPFYPQVYGVDDGKYYPGKYEKSGVLPAVQAYSALPAAAAAIPATAYTAGLPYAGAYGAYPYAGAYGAYPYAGAYGAYPYNYGAYPYKTVY